MLITLFSLYSKNTSIISFSTLKLSNWIIVFGKNKLFSLSKNDFFERKELPASLLFWFLQTNNISKEEFSTIKYI